MAPPSQKNPNLYGYHLCFFLLVCTTALSAALSTSYSSLCPSLTPSQESHTDGDDVLSPVPCKSPLVTSPAAREACCSPPMTTFTTAIGHFPFFPMAPPAPATRLSFTSPPPSPSPALAHSPTGAVCTAIITPSPGLSRSSSTATTPQSRFSCAWSARAPSKPPTALSSTTRTWPSASASYSSQPRRPLCDRHSRGPWRRRHHHLLAYAEGDDYKHGSEPTCGTPKQPARGSLQALGNVSSAWCARLKEQLVTSYRLEHGGATGALPRLGESRTMDVNQMQCTEDGAVRVYVVFPNDTRPARPEYYYRQRRFLVDEEAVVAEGRWDCDRGVLCLRACPVVRSASVPSALAVWEHECGVGMSFWFPAMWTMRDRSIVSGMLWNSTQEPTGNNDDAAALITASSVEVADHNHMIIDATGNHRSSNLSDVKYSYNDAIIEEAKKHYYLKFKIDKIKGSHSYPDNYTYRDFEFQFYGKGGMGNGQAYPVTVGSVMV